MADPRAPSCLRYRFDDLAQLRRHLHVIEGRTLLFFQDGRPKVTGGAPVQIEISFANSEQTCLLRGNVLSRVEGSSGGLWLEFPDPRLPRFLDGAGGMQRKQRRLGCDLVVQLRQGRSIHLARLVDVSPGGGRLVGATDFQKTDAELRLMAPDPGFPSEPCRCEIVRIAPGEAGVRFVRTDAATRAAVAKVVAAVQRSWAQALELSHPPACCQGGQVLEPALPHGRLKG